MHAKLEKSKNHRLVSQDAMCPISFSMKISENLCWRHKISCRVWY